MNKIVDNKTVFSPSRREFMVGTGLGLLIGFSFDASISPARAAAFTGYSGSGVNAYLQIDTLSNVKIFIGPSDMGQGIMTSMAQLVAEELCLDPLKFATQVRVETGTPDQTMVDGGNVEAAPYSKPGNYTSQSTGGSTSMRSWYKPMRTAGLKARAALIQAFNDLILKNSAATGSYISNGTIYNRANTVSASLGQVVAAAVASTGYNYTVPAVLPAYVDPTKYKFLGSDITGTKIIKRTDIPEKVLGKAKFGIDIRLDGMTHATVIHSPTIATAGSTLDPTRVPASTASTIYVPLRNERGQYNAIGIIDISATTNTWSAMNAARAFGSSWSGWINNPSIDSAVIDAAASNLIKNGSPQFVKSSDGYISKYNAFLNNVSVPTGYSTSAMNYTRYVAVQPSSNELATYLNDDVKNNSVNQSNLLKCGADLGDPAKTSVMIDATYYTPFVAHAPMEVMNCTVSISGNLIEIWAPTQSPTACIKTVKAFLGSNASFYTIKVHTTYLGGGLGRKIDQDFILQAIQIAFATNKPVKVTWSRDEDFKNDRLRPSSMMRVQMGLNKTVTPEKLSAMNYRIVTTSLSVQKQDISNAWFGSSAQKPASDDTGALAGALEGGSSLPPYTILNSWRTDVVPNNAVGLPPLGYWRSVGESYNTFAIESAVDELAAASGLMDTTAKALGSFRIGLLDSSNAAEYNRCSTVINGALALAGTLPTGTARGIAFMKGFGSYVAVVAEVSKVAVVAPTPGYNGYNVKVNKLYCAVDCGFAVNLDSVRAQIEGGLLHGLSAALYSKVMFKSGVPYNGDGSKPLSNFHTYPLVKLSNTPTMSIKIIQGVAVAGAAEVIGGVGEVGVPCVAPAIANAFFALTGNRVRAMPFYPGATMGGL